MVPSYVGMLRRENRLSSRYSLQLVLLAGQRRLVVFRARALFSLGDLERGLRVRSLRDTYV